MKLNFKRIFSSRKQEKIIRFHEKKVVSSTHIFRILEHYATKAALLQIKAKKTCLSTFCEYTGNFLQLQWVSWCSFISDIRRYLVTSLHKKKSQFQCHALLSVVTDKPFFISALIMILFFLAIALLKHISADLNLSSGHWGNSKIYTLISRLAQINIFVNLDCVSI